MSAFRDDPRWIEAQTDYLDAARPNEGDDDAFARRIQAARRLYLIECEHEGRAPDADLLARKSAETTQADESERSGA